MVRPGRPVIGFHPPAKDIRPVRFQNNIYNRLPGLRRDTPKPPTLGKSRPASVRPNNVYADRNGEVYRKTKQGWQQRTNDTWRNSGGATGSGPKTSGKPVDKGSRAYSSVPGARPVVRPAPHPELDRDFSARQRGEARVQSWSRPAPSTRQAPAPRPAPAARPAPPSHSEPKRR
jgi:hypothetical protein